MGVKYLIFAIFTFAVAFAQNDPSVQDALDKLPPELQGKVNEEQIKELQNKSTAVFKEKCVKNGGQEAFTSAEKAFADFKTCVKNLVDFNILNEEIEKAKPTGQVDEVFKKYCAKTPEFKSCFREATEAVKPCFSSEEKKNLKTVYNVTEQLAEFVCFKEGDRIALFIAENGPECFQDRSEEIQNCFNQTFGTGPNIDPNNITAESIPKIDFGVWRDFKSKACSKAAKLSRARRATGNQQIEAAPLTDLEQRAISIVGTHYAVGSSCPDSMPEGGDDSEKECSQLTELQKCVVSSLEKCDQPTSANIVESLFKFARSATPCRKYADKGEDNTRAQKAAPEKKTNSASAIAVTSATILMALSIMLL